MAKALFTALMLYLGGAILYAEIDFAAAPAPKPDLQVGRQAPTDQSARLTVDDQAKGG